MTRFYVGNFGEEAPIYYGEAKHGRITNLYPLNYGDVITVSEVVDIKVGSHTQPALKFTAMKDGITLYLPNTNAKVMSEFDDLLREAREPLEFVVCINAEGVHGFLPMTDFDRCTIDPSDPNYRILPPDKEFNLSDRAVGELAASIIREVFPEPQVKCGACPNLKLCYPNR